MSCACHERVCRVVDLGRIGYGEAWALQQRLVAARKAGAAPDVLLLCEHPHVITLGRNGKLEHLRVSADRAAADGRRISSYQSRRRHHLSRPRTDCRLSRSCISAKFAATSPGTCASSKKP